MKCIFIIFERYMEFKIPIDLLGVLLGGVVGLLLVELWEYIKKPKIQFLGFLSSKFNSGGELIKIKFRIKGKSSPGVCQIELKWNKKNVKAKWDESPNPLENDDFEKFKPELVPSTYYQQLFLNKEYMVPVLHKKDSSELSVFSGWWYGQPNYGPNPSIKFNDNLVISISGNNLEWCKSFSVGNEILIYGTT